MSFAIIEAYSLPTTRFWPMPLSRSITVVVFGFGDGGGAGFLEESGFLSEFSVMVSNEDFEQSNDNKTPCNVELIYKYSEDCINRLLEDIHRMTTRSASTLASSAVLVKFSADLSENHTGLFWTKIISIIFLLITLVLCLVLLLPVEDGEVVTFSELRYGEWYYAEKDEYMRFIIDQWVETEKQLQVRYKKKSFLLKSCYLFLAVGACFFGINIITNTVINR